MLYTLIFKIQGDTKERELLKCLVAACTVGSTAEQGPWATDNVAILVIMDQWNGQQRAFAIKMFYKNNDSLEGFTEVPIFVSPCILLYILVLKLYCCMLVYWSYIAVYFNIQVRRFQIGMQKILNFIVESIPRNWICLYFFFSYIFDLLVAFPNIWILPHFRIIS